MRTWPIILLAIIALLSQSAFAPTEDFYSSPAGFGGNWTNNQSYASQTPDDIVAWDLINSNTALYTYNFQALPASGQINWISLGLRSNFSAPFSGDDRLTLKYSLDSVVWKNLDGTAFSGSNATNQSLELRTEYYPIRVSLSWANLTGIYLGVEGRSVGSPDNEITGIDAIWLRVDYSDIEPPRINLMFPRDGNLSLANDILFGFNTTDALSNISNCSLVINDAANATNSSVSEGIVQYFRVVGMPDGFYNWSINCTDNSTNYNTNSSLKRALTIDTAGPEIILSNPLSSTEWNTTPAVSFLYNASDAIGNVSFCYLVVNGDINGTIASPIAEGAPQSFSRDISNGFYNWSVNCTDSSGIEANSTTYGLFVDVHYPNVSDVSIPDPVNLAVGSTIELRCNATIRHHKGIGLIANVNATLYDLGYYATSPDDRNNHYTNSSCEQVSASGDSANYTCSFQMYYHANPGDWRCNISATDINGLRGSEERNFTVNSLYGLSINPSYINFSALHVGQNSTSDVNITITNFGNEEVDITLHGYAFISGDGLAMNCTYGNISVENERYSLTYGTAYTGMSTLSAAAMQLDTFNLAKQTLDNTNSSRKVHWKIGIPFGVSGNCTGNIVIGAVQS